MLGIGVKQQDRGKAHLLCPSETLFVTCPWASTVQVVLTSHSGTFSSELLVIRTFSLIKLEVKQLPSLILKPLDLGQNQGISFLKESSWRFAFQGTVQSP